MSYHQKYFLKAWEEGEEDTSTESKDSENEHEVELQLQEHEGNNDDDEEDPEDPEQNQDDMRGDAESGQTIQSGKRRAESTDHDHDQPAASHQVNSYCACVTARTGGGSPHSRGGWCIWRHVSVPRATCWRRWTHGVQHGAKDT